MQIITSIILDDEEHDIVEKCQSMVFYYQHKVSDDECCSAFRAASVRNNPLSLHQIKAVLQFLKKIIEFCSKDTDLFQKALDQPDESSGLIKSHHICSEAIIHAREYIATEAVKLEQIFEKALFNMSPEPHL